MTTTTTEDHYTTTRVEVANLGSRVDRMETMMGSLGNKLDDVLALISAKGETNWQHILGAGTLCIAVLGFIGGIAYWPIAAGQNRMELSIAAQATRTDALVDKLVAAMDKRDERISLQIVPRSEHELFWKNYDRTIQRVVERLDRIEYGKVKGSN